MNKYCDMLFCVSTPQGIIQVGWQLQKSEKKQSNIACLLCGDATNETKEQFLEHLTQNHVEIANIMKLSNFKQMII